MMLFLFSLSTVDVADGRKRGGGGGGGGGGEESDKPTNKNKFVCMYLCGECASTWACTHVSLDGLGTG